MQSLITDNQEKIAELCRTHFVRSLAVFGSAVRDDFDPSRSDVDLLIEFKEEPEAYNADNYYNLIDNFERLFARRVDLLTLRFVRNPFLLRSILAEKQTIFTAESQAEKTTNHAA